MLYVNIRQDFRIVLSLYKLINRHVVKRLAFVKQTV